MTRPCNHCDGLSRSRLLHRALAEAGRGLPAIEPGMPLPAGTGLTRRRFLASSLGAAVAVYGGSRLGLRAFEEGIAAAASGPAAPILVSVFLEGGADGLSVLSPQGDPLYTKLRPQLALAGGTPLAEDDRLYWHPALGGLQQLYSEKKVTVLPAVGYTHADQSHFTSRHYWEVGATDGLRCGRAGSDGTSTGSGRRTTRSRGSRSTTRSRPPSRPPRFPSRRSRAPTNTTSTASASGARSSSGCSRRSVSSGHQPADAGLRTAGNVAAQVDRLRRQLIPFQSSNGSRAPCRIRSRTTRSRRGSRGLPPCSPRACRSTASR